MARAKAVSIINYKGGVGKTTTAYHIGCSLAFHHSKKVLLIDIDPQTNLTFLCVSEDRWRQLKQSIGTIATMYKRYLNKQPIETKRYIWHTPVGTGRYKIEGLDLIACDLELLGEDLGGTSIGGTFPSFELLKRQAAQYLNDRVFISRIIQEIEDEYDYVLIDCPPNLYVMTQNALLASDWYVVTAIPDHLSTIGLQILNSKVDRIGQMINAAQTFAGVSKTPTPIAKFGGVIFVRVRIGGSLLTNMHSSTIEQVSRLLGANSCFPTYTTELIGYGEASEGTLPVWLAPSPNARRAASKEEYEQITNEFRRRFG
jgi:chromosome partitioning protein